MLDPSIFQTNAKSGMADLTAIAELQKALTAGYGTDVSTLTGGAALRVQSLDTTMQAVIQENEDFKLFNKLSKMKAGATVDEWTEQNGIGGFLGGSTNTETGAIANATGGYARKVGLVKFLSTQRQVSLVQTLQTAIADSEATEYANGALQLLTDVEFLSFEGDSSVVPTEFDGIQAQLVAGIYTGDVQAGNIIDLRAAPLNSITAINNAAAQVRKFGNFGRLSDIFLPPSVQADLDSSLDPAFRVALTGQANSVSLGTPVTMLNVSGGKIAVNEDVFIRENDLLSPFQVNYPSFAAAQAALAPTSVTPVASSNASSLFGAGQAGNYYWLVTGINASGQSTGVITAQVAVAAGQGVALTIAASAGLLETGYVIYRSRMNGTNAPSDFRQMARIPRTGASTVYTDINYDIPGTTKAYLLDMRPAQTAITWRQLLPMMRFDLYPTNQAVIPWAQLLFGYLRMSKRKHHAVIKNILPVGATWKPFG
jgi:hypothetical protein